MRNALLPAAMAVVIAMGCEPQALTNEPHDQTRQAPAPPLVQPVMANVNGQPIYMTDLNEILVTNYGMTIAQQLIADMVVQQEANKRQIIVTDDDIAAENDYFLHGITDQQDVQPAHRRELLTRMLAEKGMSYADYERFLRRQVLLRKMVTPDIQIYEADLRNEFSRQFGRQVQVRHIQLESLAAADQVLQMLRDGADFARLAQDYSIDPSSAPNGGLLPPISSMSDECQPAIREVVLALNKPGEVSDIIRSGTTFHLLQLVREIPPQDVSFEQVKDQLHAALLRQAIDQAILSLLQRLIATADIEFTDPILRTQHALRNIGQ